MLVGGTSLSSSHTEALGVQAAGSYASRPWAREGPETLPDSEPCFSARSGSLSRSGWAPPGGGVVGRPVPPEFSFLVLGFL